MKYKKMYLQLNEKQAGYWFIPDARTAYKKLEFVPLGLSKYRNDFNVEVDHIPHKKIVFMYDSDFCKKRAKIQFRTESEQMAYEEAYDKYYDVRWEEMPKVEMSDIDYKNLEQKWESLNREKPEYAIFLLDDSQRLDKVDVVGKNELSKEDLQEMKRENEECLRWQRAERLYNDDHEIVDDLWRSPADSVYDADIAKYLDRTEGFAERKKYTKTDVIVELQEKLKRKEPVYLIVHWLRIRMVYGVVDSNLTFDDLLGYFENMDVDYSEMISREKLQDIADRLSLGQDVVLD